MSDKFSRASDPLTHTFVLKMPMPVGVWMAHMGPYWGQQGPYVPYWVHRDPHVPYWVHRGLAD